MEKSLLLYYDTVIPMEKIKMSAARGLQWDFSYEVIVSQLDMNTCNLSFISLAKKLQTGVSEDRKVTSVTSTTCKTWLGSHTARSRYSACVMQKTQSAARNKCSFQEAQLQQQNHTVWYDRHTYLVTLRKPGLFSYHPSQETNYSTKTQLYFSKIRRR